MVPGFMVSGPDTGLGRGRGFGFGRGMAWKRGFGMGFGRGFGPGFVPPAPLMQPQPTKEQEMQILKQDLEFLNNQVDAIKKRIQELEETEL